MGKGIGFPFLFVVLAIALLLGVCVQKTVVLWLPSVGCRLGSLCGFPSLLSLTVFVSGLL